MNKINLVNFNIKDTNKQQLVSFTNPLIKDILPIPLISFYTPLECYGIRPNYYYITDDGNVYKNTVIYNKPLKVRIDDRGYRYIGLMLENGKQKWFKVARLVGETFIQREKEEDNIINHLDLRKYNDKVPNLEWTTLSGNTQHALKTGAMKVGEEHPSSILTNEQVHEICKLLEKGNMTRKEIAISVGLQPNEKNLHIIGNIKVGRCWKHISKNYNIPRYKKSRLTEEMVEEICKDMENGMKTRDILIKNGLELIDNNFDIISTIRRGITYKHISCKYKLK